MKIIKRYIEINQKVIYNRSIENKEVNIRKEGEKQ